MKMALADWIDRCLIARLKLGAAQVRLDRRHDRAPSDRIMTTQPNCFDSNRESQKSEESISRSRYQSIRRSNPFDDSEEGLKAVVDEILSEYQGNPREIGRSPLEQTQQLATLRIIT